MHLAPLFRSSVVVVSVLFVACAAPTGGGHQEGDRRAVVDEAITSEAAQILDFRFPAEVVASSDADARKAILSQLMYTQGQLTTGYKANGQVGNVRLSDIRETSGNGTKRIRYTAAMPVAWPKDRGAPNRFELVLPLDMTRTDDFNAKYDGKCGHHEWDSSTFWHDWNPAADGCSIDEPDVTRAPVSVGPSARATGSKYPEYDLMWADGKLRAVALFGIITKNDHGDWGYTGAKSFAERVTRQLYGARMKRNAATSSILSDVTITGRAAHGDVQVDVILVRDLASLDGDFDARYDGLSEDADLILYNGHAGLGRNVNAFANEGRVAAGKYQLVLMNGCQTFAYLDSTCLLYT